MFSKKTNSKKKNTEIKKKKKLKDLYVKDKDILQKKNFSFEKKR